MGIARQTVSDVCEHVVSQIPIEGKRNSRRISRKMPRNKREMFFNDVPGKLDGSLRKLERKYRLDKNCLNNILRQNQLVLKSRKSGTKYTAKQISEQRMDI